MASFVGRTSELNILEDVYKCNIRNCYVEAAPHTGSTALLKKFCEKHKGIHIRFGETALSESYASFTRALENYTREPLDLEDINFNTLFRSLSKAIKGFDPVIIFDGTQNVPEPFPAELKEFSDNEDVMIVLIGHNDPKQYGITFTGRIELKELALRECNLLHPKMTAYDNLKTFMTIGGVPPYHTVMNKSDYPSSVEKAFLGNCPKLMMECENILRKSSVPYPICCTILSDIANCIGRPVEIAEKEGISRQLCDIYLKKLLEEGIIRTLVPIGNSPKKPVYIIDSPLIAFYFIAIRMNPRIEFEEKPDFKSIENHVEMFMELRFRDICETYLRKNYNCIKVGRWWTRDEDTNKPTLAAVVDIEGEQRTIIADCKFRNSKIDQGALKAFITRSSQVSDTPKISLMMISASGFDEKLIKKAKAENVVLVSLNEIM